MDEKVNFAELLVRGFREEIAVLSKDFHVIAANETFCRTHGVQSARIAGQPCYAVLSACREGCRESISNCPLREALFTGQKASATILDLPSTWSERNRHFLIEVFPVPPRTHGEGFFLHITREITDSVEEERLKEKMWMEILGRLEKLYGTMIASSEEIAGCKKELENLAETIPLALLRWDREGRLFGCNGSAEILFGLTSIEMAGKPFSALFASGSSQESFQKNSQAILRGDTIEYSVAENRTAGGRILTCEWYHSPMYGQEGKIEGGMSIGQDVTERANMLKALKISQSQVHALLHSVNDAIVSVNNLGRISMWSDSAERLFGWRREEILGQEPEVLMPAEMRSEHRERIKKFFLSPAAGNFSGRILEATALSRKGVHLSVSIALTVEEIDGKTTIFAAIRNLADRKRLEKILIQSEKTRELGEMAHGIAHELNNTLGAILANVQFLLKTTRDETLRAQLGDIEKAATEGARKVSRLAGQGREELGMEKIFISMPLQKLIEDALEFTSFRWKDQMQKDGYTVNITTEFAEIPPILVIASEFREMLTNIIFNAIDAMPQGGNLHLSSRVEGHEINLTCEDDGEGIASDILDRIFEPFFTTRGVGHAGLGLTMARGIAHRHSGRIMARSTKGLGTAVSVRLPLAVTTVIPDGKPPSIVVPTGRYTILVIDDEALVREALSRILRAAGHKVVCAAEGKEGVRTFRENHFDLVISDLGMPVMGGSDAITRIKRLKPDVPVILVTGWGVAADQVRHRTTSVDEIIAKPFDIDRILDAVSRLCVAKTSET